MKSIVSQHARQTMRIVEALLILAWAVLVRMPVAADEVRCVALDLYVREGQHESAQAQEVLSDFLKTRTGVSVTVYDLNGPNAAKSRMRLQGIAEYFRFESETPVIYGCGQGLRASSAGAISEAQLQRLLRVDVYTRAGCPRCVNAKAYLQRFAAIYPGLEVRIRDIVPDPQARADLDRLVRQYQQAAASVPVFHLCNQLVIGWDLEAITGRRLEQVLAPWTYTCQLPQKSPASTGNIPVISFGPHWRSSVSLEAGSTSLGLTRLLSRVVMSSEPEQSDDMPLRDAEWRGLPIPGRDEPLLLPTVGDEPSPAQATPSAETMEVPVFGRLDAARLGLPMFTIAVGLVDGFNPCAMWVLLFLLSLLVNLHDRRRILAVAGTFVVISGLAYFTFMAAWLNVFRLVGLLRPVQVILALTAIIVGAIHIKDFFAFKQGISLSIPESAKPGIYARVRRIVTAENLWGAVIGAIALALMVNIIELLCTAGLPAMYTGILTMQQLPKWQNYAYLGLYNAAYMFDDMLMVGLVVITLGRRHMQEQHGRILKLVSGAAILLLGLTMLIKPEWLV